MSWLSSDVNNNLETKSIRNTTDTDDDTNIIEVVRNVNNGGEINTNNNTESDTKFKAETNTNNNNNYNTESDDDITNDPCSNAENTNANNNTDSDTNANNNTESDTKGKSDTNANNNTERDRNVNNCTTSTIRVQPNQESSGITAKAASVAQNKMAASVAQNKMAARHKGNNLRAQSATARVGSAGKLKLLIKTNSYKLGPPEGDFTANAQQSSSKHHVAHGHGKKGDHHHKGNTYRMEPTIRFENSMTVKMLKSVLEHIFNGYTYNINSSSGMALNVAHTVQQKVNTILAPRYPRYKFVCHVTLASLTGQGIKVADRFLFDGQTDDFGVYTYHNQQTLPHFVCVATLYGLYFE